jgi:LmbE family N-acetylglucosaminyl deacetylase
MNDPPREICEERACHQNARPDRLLASTIRVFHASDNLSRPMIVPLSSEEEWTSVWEAATSWQPYGKPILVISPHPDDETLGVGGLISTQISEGTPVKVIAVTDGENAYGQGDSTIAANRRMEQTAALEQLGLKSSDIVRFGLTDSDVSSEQNTLAERLLPLVSNETHIFAPWIGDFHPDHEACGRAAQTVARSAGASLTFYFFWTWHRGTPQLLQGLPLRSLSLSANHRRSKLRALSQYRSQLEHPSGEPILPDELLWPARRSTEIFLPS